MTRRTRLRKWLVDLIYPEYTEELRWGIAKNEVEYESLKRRCEFAEHAGRRLREVTDDLRHHITDRVLIQVAPDPILHLLIPAEQPIRIEDQAVKHIYTKSVAVSLRQWAAHVEFGIVPDPRVDEIDKRLKRLFLMLAVIDIAHKVELP